MSFGKHRRFNKLAFFFNDKLRIPINAFDANTIYQVCESEPVYSAALKTSHVQLSPAYGSRMQKAYDASEIMQVPTQSEH